MRLEGVRKDIFHRRGCDEFRKVHKSLRLLYAKKDLAGQMPWVRVRYLASTILSLCARQLPADWERLYGYRPLLLETLVDAKFRGTSYEAANWAYLDET